MTVRTTQHITHIGYSYRRFLLTGKIIDGTNLPPNFSKQILLRVSKFVFNVVVFQNNLKSTTLLLLL